VIAVEAELRDHELFAKELLDVAVCPTCKQRLVYFEQEGFLLCPASRLSFPIIEGVPVFLVDEATELAQPEVDRMLKQAKELGLPGA